MSVKPEPVPDACFERGGPSGVAPARGDVPVHLRGPVFEALTDALRGLLAVPHALIAVASGDRYWVSMSGTFRELAAPVVSNFYSVIRQTGETIVVNDAKQDIRFRDPAHADRDDGYAFFVGMPLTTSTGELLGILCGLDHMRRDAPSEQQLGVLRKLADAAVSTIELQASEHALRQKSELLQATLDAITQGVSVFDSSLDLVAWNAHATRLLGVPDDAVRVGTPYQEIGVLIARQGALGHGDPVDMARERAKVLSGREPSSRELRFPGGRVVETCSVPLASGGFVATHTDVTLERRKAKDLALAAKRAKLEARVARIANEAKNLRSALGCVLAATCQEYGFDSGRIYAGRDGESTLFTTGIMYDWHSGTVLHDDGATLPADSPLALQALLGDRVAFVGPAYAVIDPPGRGVDHYPAGGAAFVVQLLSDIYVLECIGDPRGSVRPWHQDILRHVEQQLGRVAERDRLEKLKTEFTSTINHELRTPLTTISGILDLLEAGVVGDIPAEAREMVLVAQINTRRLGDLIEDVLDLEAIDNEIANADRVAGSVHAAVEDAIAQTADMAEAAGVSVAFTAVEADDVALLQHQRFAQAIRNVLSNAIKFSPRNGVVSIAVGRHRETIRVSIADRGPGIPKDFEARLFSRFSQADGSDARQASGTGLGLAIVKQIVDRLGGAVSYDSLPGQGTTFHLDIQAAARPDAGPHAPDESQA